MQIINPATEQLIKEVKEDTKESLIEKLRTLQRDQPIWERKSIAERVKGSLQKGDRVAVQGKMKISKYNSGFFFNPGK